MFQALAGLLAFFYDLIPSYVAAIALLTVTVMLVLTPLTWKSTRSMLEMQRLQPELKKLQAKHKNDRQKLSEETMALYKEHNVNPAAGCLPMLLQMPVLFVMYRVIDGLGRAEPKYISRDTDLYQDLVRDGGRMLDFGMDFARRASQSHGSFGKALPYFVIIALVVATQYIQTKQMQGRTNTPPSPQMVMMQRVMPIFFGFISFSIAAGVNVYFVVSSLFRIAQQALMYQLDPVLKAHVADKVQAVEAKVVEKPKAPVAKASTNGGKPKSGNSKNRKGGGARAKKGR